MLAGGFWHDPECCDTFRSAMTVVHANAHGQVGEYRELCPECSTNYAAKGFGCKYHASQARPCRSGNVCLSSGFVDTDALIKATNMHKVQGASHILPREVRMLGKYCIASNDLFYLGMYALLLVSIDLFLRKVEFSSLELANFNTTMFVMTDEYIIDALNLKVKGKKKKKSKKGKQETMFAR